ncbi:RagB/SusD family nutrient uptake outer membrane protein [Albibacterium sp.]|uniref:RagB/SusD family nutrient uptake outer membrane protein n=1 Tax=Albibacterium sp. TaxID=2952885 RepID=UPI002BB1949E|nr:RagB/SusD family nutrient uptake outer membrane protein [Albibacterium sp.]HUH20153.1 RagB/SusD family nutrient uptake outer membrane protein [Albibacterium sp.]
MKKIHSVIFTLIVCVTLFSCKDDFIEQLPIGSFPQSIITTPDGIKKALTGAYSSLNGSANLATGPGQFLFGSIRGGEANRGSGNGVQPQMSEIQKFSVNSSNSSVLLFFTHFGDAIARTNMVLKNLPLVEGITDGDKIEIEAEARFLRAHYHFMLKRVFKNIPWLDEASIDDPRVPNTDESGNFIDVWPNIAADFKFAAENLPPTQPIAGRPNKWAAKAYYGKILLYMGNEGDDANYTLAKTQFDDVISNGVTYKGEKYALAPNYHDNFNSQKENGPESVFAVQHEVNDGSENNRANASQDLLYIGSQSPSGPALGRGYAYFNPSQWFVNHFRVDANGLPIFDDEARNASFIKNDDGIESSAAFTPDAGLIDPRLDWSVGRRGIPFLDYGIMPGKAWVRDQAYAGPYVSKKFFTLKSRDGIDTAPGRPENNLNIAIIRFADVLLMAAEVDARLGNTEQARIYVNQIRNRMATNTANPENWVLNTDGTPAANYKIALYPVGSPQFASLAKALEAIFFERTLELGLEGHRAYDAIRFGAEDGTTDEREFNGYLTYESTLRGFVSGAVYSRDPDAIIPLSQKAIENSFKDGKLTLTQSPGY